MTTTERVLSTVRPDGDTAVVRVADRYATTAEDLWSALTDPERLARWIVEVEGDLRVGGDVRLRFTSGWEGAGRIEVCDAPDHLQVVTVEDGGGRTVIDAVLTADGDGTTLVVEDRGLPVDDAPDHAAGWQVHLEDLAALIAGGEPSDWHARWVQLRPLYRGV